MYTQPRSFFAFFEKKIKGNYKIFAHKKNAIKKSLFGFPDFVQISLFFAKNAQKSQKSQKSRFLAIFAVSGVPNLPIFLRKCMQHSTDFFDLDWGFLVRLCVKNRVFVLFFALLFNPFFRNLTKKVQFWSKKGPQNARQPSY